MTEAIYKQEGDSVDFTPVAAITAGEMVLLPDGRAAFCPDAIAAGALGAARVKGIVTLSKAADVVLLQGGLVRWDASASVADVPVLTNDLDFIIGRVEKDAAASDTTVDVVLNVFDTALISLNRSGFLNVPVLTAGTPYGKMMGNAFFAGFSATAEAQKEDILSNRSVPISSNWIVEGVVEVVTNADTDVADLNIGVANASHASDADAITESVFVHFDMGADLNIDCESDDGTTEVAATDSTVDWAVGTPVHFAIDGRDESDIQFYINGANVLPATVFTLADATGPIKLLCHLEKSANDSPGEIRVDLLELRITPEL